MISFRGHHLVCLHFFQGEGYSREFVDNLCHLLQKADEDGEIVVVEGADDVCRACPHLEGNRCSHKQDSDREVRRLDGDALRLLEVKPGDRIKWQDLRLKVKAASDEWFALFCGGCDWKDLCSR